MKRHATVADHAGADQALRVARYLAETQAKRFDPYATPQEHALWWAERICRVASKLARKPWSREAQWSLKIVIEFWGWHGSQRLPARGELANVTAPHRYRKQVWRRPRREVAR